MKKRLIFCLTFIFILPLLSGSACAASGKERWESSLAEAKKEGKVVIYGQVGPELRVALAEAIKKDLGLSVELVPGKGREVLVRFTKEIQAGLPSADIILGGGSAVRTDPDLYALWDRLEPLLILPEVLDSKAWPNGKLPFLDKEKKIGPLTLEVTQLLVVNTDIVKPGQIKAYRDLLQPQWKGKIVMYDPTSGGTAQSWIKLILTKAYNLTEGEAFLRKFASQEPVITRDSRLQSEWVARGRYPVCIGLDPQAAYQMQKSGAPITRLAAEEGGMYSGVLYMVTPVKRPHPKAANAVINWLLSARGQEVYSNAYGAPAARIGVRTDQVSKMALPIPGEKLYVQDEDFVLFTDDSIEVAKRVFAPLLK